MSNEELNIKDKIMQKIKSGEIKIKPKWYFALGSILSVLGLVGVTLVIIFFTNLMLFFLRTNSYMRGFRYEQIISNFPWWALLLAILGISLGVIFLKKYDFSYRKNFQIILVIIILSIFIASWIFDLVGLNEAFIRKGMMKNIYRKYDGRGMMKMQNNWDNFRQ